MAARFVDVSESEIDQFKENAVPQKNKTSYKIWSQPIQRSVDKISVLQLTQFTENWYVCLHFFASKCRQLLVTFAKHFVLQNGFNTSKSSQMK